MARTFAIADLHLEHIGIVTTHKSELDPSKKARPWYTLSDMHDALTYNWNTTVRPEDTVYVLGDVALNPAGLSVLRGMVGNKILIGGNHDRYSTHEYLKYFSAVFGCCVVKNLVLSHIPVHPCQLKYKGGRWRGNVHGHLHESRVMDGAHVDPNYFCVSVEQIEYAPVLLDSVSDKIIAAKQAFNQEV